MKYIYSQDMDKITIINEETSKEYIVLCTFDSDITDKSYVVFTDMTTNDSNQINTYAVELDLDSDDAFEPDEDDVELINEVIEEIRNEVLNTPNVNELNMDELSKNVEKNFE